MRPSLVLLAGPNGAGKTSLYESRVAPGFAGPFINADIIQRDELQDPSTEASCRAARIAEARRVELLEAGRSFATETVFSHSSRLEVVEAAREGVTGQTPLVAAKDSHTDCRADLTRIVAP